MYLEVIMHSDRINKASSYIRRRIGCLKPEIGVILGSGLGEIGKRLKDRILLDFEEIPNWPRSTVKGHPGKVVFGRMGDVETAFVQGRVHLYEGYSIDRVVFPIRVLGRLGIKILIITNAAGGLNPSFNEGDVMIITDQINFTFTNPLIDSSGIFKEEMFLDMSSIYDKRLISIAERAADRLGISFHKGVLVGVRGPVYETKAEVKMMRMLGGDAVCMSTVSEVIAGVYEGMHILGISCITNPATGLSERRLNHEEVKKTANRFSGMIGDLIEEIIKNEEWR